MNNSVQLQSVLDILKTVLTLENIQEEGTTETILKTKQ